MVNFSCFSTSCWIFFTMTEFWDKPAEKSGKVLEAFLEGLPLVYTVYSSSLLRGHLYCLPRYCTEHFEDISAAGYNRYILVCFDLFRCFEPISKLSKQTELFRNKPIQPKIFLKIPNYALYQTVSVALLFVSVQSKHRNSLFRYRSETTKTNCFETNQKNEKNLKNPKFPEKFS